ncbi:MAG: aminotransferase class I/II-fold pyridoxal phosphate-dependent enzyme [Deltaproteobacteria bacterium]|nr:aminotransferase class I/II-fold pyridoxal phosphate-dependent enzyme [Deltaproteobacteria bacterium]
MNAREPVSLDLRVRGIGESPTLAINQRCAELRRKGVRVHRLGLGQSPFPVPSLVVETLRANAHRKDYLPVRGLPELREAVADFHHRTDRLDVPAEGVLIGPGSKELMFLLQVCFYGEIVVPTPCWVSYVPQARILGREVRRLPTRFEDGWKVAPEALDRVLSAEHDPYRPRLLVLNYPANPHGGTYSSTELEDIVRVARRYSLVLLSDEIYGQLHYSGNHVSVGRFYPEGTILSSGLSKWCGAGGWRLGTFAFPPRLGWLLDAMAAVASETYTAVSAPIQYAAVTAFRGGAEIERYLCHARRILRALGDRCLATLAGSGMRVHRAEGAFYLFPDLGPLAEGLAARGIRTSEALCERLLDETGVAVLPGSVFERRTDELTLRLAFVDFDGARALAASETTPLDQPLPDSFVEQLCPGPLEGCRRLADWAAG